VRVAQREAGGDRDYRGLRHRGRDRIRWLFTVATRRWEFPDANVLSAGARGFREFGGNLDKLGIGDNEERVALGESESIQRDIGGKGQLAVVDLIVRRSHRYWPAAV
jgi:hypothetical protein